MFITQTAKEESCWIGTICFNVEKRQREKETEEEEEDPAVPSMEPPPAVIMGAVYERWAGC